MDSVHLDLDPAVQSPGLGLIFITTSQSGNEKLLPKTQNNKNNKNNKKLNNKILQSFFDQELDIHWLRD